MEGEEEMKQDFTFTVYVAPVVHRKCPDKTNKETTQTNVSLMYVCTPASIVETLKLNRDACSS